MSTFLDRLTGAMCLNAGMFEEIEADSTATRQAMIVVVLSSVAAGIGTLSVGRFQIETLTLGTLAALIGWIAWASVTYLIGTHLLAEPQTRANLEELLRTTGFASAPGVLRVIGVVPGFGGSVYLATSIWMLAAMVVAVRQALDFTTTGRAVAVCAAGWVLSLILAVVVGVVFGPTVQ